MMLNFNSVFAVNYSIVAPVFSNASTTNMNQGFCYATSNYGDLYIQANADFPIYYTVVHASNSSNYSLYFWTTDNYNDSSKRVFFNLIGSNNTLTSSSQYQFYQNSGNLYYKISSINYNGASDAVFNFNVPVYSTMEDAKAAVISYINTPSSSIGDGYLTNGLPVGNVIYFDLGSSGVEYDVTLKSSFTSKSSWFGSTWVNDNRRYGFTDELPTTATNFSESSGSSIPWYPSGSTDLLGRSDEGSANISGTSTGRYLWILNPLYNLGYYDEPDKGTSLNGNIFYIGGISVDTPYYIYSLKQSATSLGLSSDVASSVGGVGSVTSSGAINTVVNDGSDTEYVPSVGGDNTPPQEVSATEGIKQTLDQFVQMFLNIFTAPISHIQQLISAGSEFISHFSNLWSWLPDEVSGFVVSSFVVMIAISIFKLFL